MFRYSYLKALQNGFLKKIASLIAGARLELAIIGYEPIGLAATLTRYVASRGTRDWLPFYTSCASSYGEAPVTHARTA